MSGDPRSIDPARWESIKNIVYEALQRQGVDRQRFLDEKCSGAPDLRAEVDSLLGADGDDSFWDKAASGFWHDGLEIPQGLVKGQTLAGRYRLLHPLGEGGMGQVWLAEQLAPVQRQVALKLIRGGLFDATLRQRFQAECQSLAMMDHPAIAKIFDAGTTEMGQPFLAMEYVAGIPLVYWCDQRTVSVDDRLRLFIEACDGVQHAHQKAIIHRDLKPSNILVAEIDGRPRPRIIDFGLAKAATPADGADLLTHRGQLLGTPGYMSPEQTDPTAIDIDTRADVYALGIILYELLCGSLPFDRPNGARVGFQDWMKRLKEEDAPPPSRKLMENAEHAATTARARGSEVGRLRRTLREDLDWIALRAIDRRREYRYGTAAELAEDLRRYLHSEPVLARPPSRRDWIAKYIRRHRIAVSVAGVVMLALAALATVESIEVRRIARERDRADRITDFMSQIFKIADPSQSRGNQVTARELLDRAAGKMSHDLAQDPDALAELQYVMARTYTNLGLFTRAHELAAQSLAWRERHLDAHDSALVQSLTQLGWIKDREGDPAGGEVLERRALQALGDGKAGRDQLAYENLNILNILLQEQGKLDQAEVFGRRAIEAARRAEGPSSTAVLQATNNLGTILLRQGRFTEVEPLYRQLVADDRRVLGEDNPETLLAEGNFAGVLGENRHYAESEAQFRQLLAVDQRVIGPEHRNTVMAMINLGEILTLDGKFTDAEPVQRQSVDILTRTIGLEHSLTRMARLDLSTTLVHEGRLSEAESLQRAVVEGELKTLGADDPDLLIAQSYLALTWYREGRFSDAATQAEPVLTRQIKLLGLLNDDTLKTLRTATAAFARIGHYEKVEDVRREFQSNSAKNGSRELEARVWYAFGCAAAIVGRGADALEYLREATTRGFNDLDDLEHSEDWSSLRGQGEFQRLVDRVRRQLTPG